MVAKAEIEDIISKYPRDAVSVATIGSHSALNVFKGAREVGLKTVCMCTQDRKRVYDKFGLVDEYIMLNDLQDIKTERVQ
ncbi:MAG: DUF1246 domain-containing protein, partial [Candidatus Altiarchaeota archaeon]|nr:DUF1246 domain-containing protein [Candidatus Altiarchaeota archaeon]